MAKGKDFAIVKMYKGKKYKEFEEIKFFHQENLINLTIINIAAGDEHVILLDIDRNIWGWGSNAYKQINPYSEEKFYKKFEKMEYSKIIYGVKSEFVNTVFFKIIFQYDLKIEQIFCMPNTSMFVYNRNVVKMIGSTSEGFMGNEVNPDFESGHSKVLYEYKELEEFISYDLHKKEKNITDIFINCKKIFYFS